MKTALAALMAMACMGTAITAEARVCRDNSMLIKGVPHILKYEWNGRRCRMVAAIPVNQVAKPPAPPHDEYGHSRVLGAIGADRAYQRGWTGRGSTVLIMDSGIQINHPELTGKIKLTRDFTGTGLGDTTGHGTHLAGLIAARRDGKGMHGVAPDAQLAIAKIATGTRVNFGAVNAAMSWAAQYPDVVVANLSANINYDRSYQNSMSQVSPGMFVSQHAHYGGNNYYNLERPESIAIPQNMVLVVSAGNTNLGYVQNPATFAAAENAQGDLVHGGRMLIAGAWNTGFKKIEGARSGHVCKSWYNGTCQDRYRVSDFYILAPGTAVSTGANSDLRTMGGTSQAAAVVSGAVAVINQMWPYMTPENQARLLLTTANRDIPGYDVNTHGQGLLDLDRATQPVGAIGIPTTGRGQQQPVGLMSVPAVTGVIGATSSVVAYDGFDRHFMVNLAPAVQTNSLRDRTIYDAQSAGQSWLRQWMPEATAVTLDSSMWHAQPQDTTWQISLVSGAQTPWAEFSGMWGRTANTTSIEYLHRWTSPDTGMYTQAGLIHSRTRLQPGIVTALSGITAATVEMGWRDLNSAVWMGLEPTVVHGDMTLSLADSVDAQGRAQFRNHTVDLRESARAFMAVQHRVDLGGGSSLSLGARAREHDQQAHITWNQKW